jgi:hypothetical protein
LFDAYNDTALGVVVLVASANALDYVRNPFWAAESVEGRGAVLC